MRGKRYHRRFTARDLRIIPAHAGQTVAAFIDFRVDADHPRACGANMGGSPEGEAQFGSSPRMRGKPSGSTGWRARSRIIPAHAGQT